MPPRQAQRDLIARMKLIPVEAFIRNKSLLLIDDSIVRGTQLRETTEFLYRSGAKAVHVRPACPPILYGCKYLNFSRSNSDKMCIRDSTGADPAIVVQNIRASVQQGLIQMIRLSLIHI